jgi:hypothetical protein
MLLDAKSRRHESAKIVEASGDIESSIAFLALKMVMVPYIRPFVPRRLTRNLDCYDPTLV